jgi:hypothetical protein
MSLIVGAVLAVAILGGGFFAYKKYLAAPPPPPPFKPRVIAQPVVVPTPVVEKVTEEPAPVKAAPVEPPVQTKVTEVPPPVPVVVTPPPPPPPPPASPVFKAWVENLKIGGVRAGATTRVFIGGTAYASGDLVNPQLGIMFDSYNSETRMLTFRDKTGAKVDRRN